MKLRNNRAVCFRHFGVMAGAGHIISGNHFWQSDDSAGGERSAGLVLSARNLKSVITANYVDNCWIEISNEHDAYPDGGPGEFGFGNVSVTANIFTANTVPSWFSWLHLAPYGTGHRIDGISVIGNAFRCVAAGHVVDRVEMLDGSHGAVDLALTRDLIFAGNSFEQVNLRSQSPLTVSHAQAGESAQWTVPAAALPFGARALAVDSVTVAGALSGTGGQQVYALPHVAANQGAGGGAVVLNWPEAVKGTVQVRLRGDLAA